MSQSTGILYVVATPIGNQGDITPRAVETLKNVDLIAAEDTRHSRPMLSKLGISTPLMAVHEHNEIKMVEKLCTRLEEGDSIALISDAGTPLISDPGFPLIRACQERGLQVCPIPGPSALICALSACGLPTDRFQFEGFPARTSSARQQQFEALSRNTATLIFYESSHRIAASLDDMAQVFGNQRQAAIARELTKVHETILQGTLETLVLRVAEDENQRKGEFVVVIAGAPKTTQTLDPEAERILQILVEELHLKQAAALASSITGEKRNKLYKRALELKA